MLRKIWAIFYSVFLVLFLGLTLNSTAFAASTCKGLTKTKCNTKLSCSWVDSYKTKSGTRVNGYCRAKPGKGAGSGSGSKKKVTNKGQELKKKKPITHSSSARKLTKKTSSKSPKPAKESAKKTGNKTH